jgi:hypothetical protein
LDSTRRRRPSSGAFRHQHSAHAIEFGLGIYLSPPQIQDPTLLKKAKSERMGHPENQGFDLGKGRPLPKKSIRWVLALAPSKVLFRANLGFPFGGPGSRSTPDLCLWTHVPRRGVTMWANSASVTIYGCRRHTLRRRWGRPLGVCDAVLRLDEKGEVQTDAEDSQQSDLENF